MKKYQVNMFIGTQSFVLRTNSIKELLKFTGAAKLHSDQIRQYLTDLDRQVFGPKTPAPKKSGKLIDTPDYIYQVKSRLANMGVMSEKEALKVIRQRSGLKLKNIGQMTQEQAGTILALLMVTE